VALAAVCASLLIVPVTAGAKAPAAPVKTVKAMSFKNIPMSGKTQGGQTFTGNFTVNRFVRRHGKTYALGTLTVNGTLNGRSVPPTNVAIPVALASRGKAPRQAAGTCTILTLTLGPLHLNLLGLHVDLNRVNLRITAVPGPGNLLGNLLCDVANLLNPGSGLSGVLATFLTDLNNLLNSLGL
jgi:hypothetical protein